MKIHIYCGSTSDGKEHWLEIDSENSITGNEKNYTLPIGSIYSDERRREYWPFLEPL